MDPSITPFEVDPIQHAHDVRHAQFQAGLDERRRLRQQWRAKADAALFELSGAMQGTHQFGVLHPGELLVPVDARFELAQAYTHLERALAAFDHVYPSLRREED